MGGDRVGALSLNRAIGGAHVPCHYLFKADVACH